MPTINEIKLKPIGFVRLASKRENVKDKSLVSEIIVLERLTKALEGIEEFSHVFVLFYMHQVLAKEVKSLKVHPRGRMGMPLVGLYATRTQLRPNPIGLAVVELLQRKENVLVVRGLDAFNGTPVLDLKPYDNWDAITNVRVPEWRKQLEMEVTSQKH
jgi:tRNA-Thr(GGU) m(6)t(6)A37 methyltransferase TsaA